MFYLLGFFLILIALLSYSDKFFTLLGSKKQKTIKIWFDKYEIKQWFGFLGFIFAIILVLFFCFSLIKEIKWLLLMITIPLLFCISFVIGGNKIKSIFQYQWIIDVNDFANKLNEYLEQKMIKNALKILLFILGLLLLFLL